MKKQEKIEKTEQKVYDDLDLAKALYKAILKTLGGAKSKKVADAIVDDILDPNDVAEVDPETIPNRKDKVMYKSSKSLKSKKKSTKKLKDFIDKCSKDEPIIGLSQK